jgi:hypothetical protein
MAGGSSLRIALVTSAAESPVKGAAAGEHLVPEAIRLKSPYPIRRKQTHERSHVYAPILGRQTHARIARAGVHPAGNLKPSARSPQRGNCRPHGNPRLPAHGCGLGRICRLSKDRLRSSKRLVRCKAGRMGPKWWDMKISLWSRLGNAKTGGPILNHDHRPVVGHADRLKNQKPPPVAC